MNRASSFFLEKMINGLFFHKALKAESEVEGKEENNTISIVHTIFSTTLLVIALLKSVSLFSYVTYE